MAFSTILRRSAASIAPIGARIMHNQKRSAPALFTALYHQATAAPVKPPAFFSSFSSIHHFSSAAKVKNSTEEEELLCVLDDEIDSAVNEEDPSFEIPADFPFEVEDNPGEQTVTLTRGYQGEKISVRVHMPDIIGGEDDASGDNDESQTSVPLVVRVLKKNGQSLEFGCTAFEDEIAIDSLSFKEPGMLEDEIPYEGPEFSDLDENLQKAFQKYLEVRGIKPSMTNDLYELMVNKDSREYTAWLKNLKNFIEA